MARPRLAIALAAIAGCAVALAIGYLLKTNCLPQEAASYPPLCYSDITALYESRDLGRGAVPYLDFPRGGSYRDRGFLEYPVGTGAVAALTAAAAGSRDTYLAWNGLVLAATALAAAGMLATLAGRAAIRWSAAPALALYAFHNWDLLAVGLVVLGCLTAARGRIGWAGIAFGLGAAVKLFPALFVVPLVLERTWRGDRVGAVRALGGGIGAALIPNALVAAINPEGWWATYAFHSARGVDLGSWWAWVLPELSATMVNVLTGLPVVAAGVAVLAYGRRLAARDGAYPFLPVASALLAVFLLFSKIASPQQALWLLPSLVLLGVPLRWWVAWNGFAVIVYGASFGVGLLGYEFEMARSGIGVSAFIRAALLAALTIVFVRSPAAPLPAAQGRRSIAQVSVGASDTASAVQVRTYQPGAVRGAADRIGKKKTNAISAVTPTVAATHRPAGVRTAASPTAAIERLTAGATATAWNRWTGRPARLRPSQPA